MGRKSKSAKTYQTLLFDRLASMKVEESFSKKDLIIEIWGNYDYFVCRSFDVFFTHIKKQIPEKEFRTIKGFIHRLK